METRLRLICAKELRRMLGGIGATTLWRLEKNEQIPPGRKIGKQRYWREDELMDWLSKPVNKN